LPQTISKSKHHNFDRPPLSTMANNNATYALDIPVLGPLASGLPEIQVAAIAQGNPISSDDIVAATQQYKIRKRLQSCSPALATSNEVVQARRRKHAVESAQFDGPTPAWAQQLQAQMQGQMQQMQALQQMQAQMQGQMQQMQRDLQAQMQTQNDRLERCIQIESQRSRNYARHTTGSAVAKLMTASDGTMPPGNLWFPANQNELVHATSDQMIPLFNFYQLPQNGTVAEKRDRLADHLGVIL
jgi:TolA-binding protein